MSTEYFFGIQIVCRVNAVHCCGMRTETVRRGSRTLAQRVYAQLKRDIIRGVFKPGEAISERVLTTRYKGSRTPVREAAVRLQQENLLRIVPNRGYFVEHISLHELNEIYEFRAAVEGACAELAALKGVTEQELRRLRILGQTEYGFDSREGYIRFIEADTEFHNGIADLTRNRYLMTAVAEMRSQMERIMYAAIDVGYYGEAPIREHADVLNAIAAGDGQLARRLMYNHILGSKDKVLLLAGEWRSLGPHRSKSELA